MASIPTHCPTCVTDDGVWAYGRLVFDHDPVWPRCMICKGRLVPAESTRGTSIVLDLTGGLDAATVPGKAYASLRGDSATGLVSGPADESVGALGSGTHRSREL